MKLKKDSFLSKRFNMDVNNVQKLVDVYFIPAYPGCVFNVKKSESTNSIYISVEYSGDKTELRLSDHDSRNHVQASRLICEYTTNKDVARFLRQAIDDLMMDRLYNFLDNNKKWL